MPHFAFGPSNGLGAARDREFLRKWLPFSSVASNPKSTPEDELLKIVRSERNRKRKRHQTKCPSLPSWRNSIKKEFACSLKGVAFPEVEQFLNAIEHADLWHLASRPLDFDWLVRFWKSEGRQGTLQEMVERRVIERLKETNPDRARPTDLAGGRGAKRRGAHRRGNDVWTPDH
jgi:hypothetical protein